MGLGTYIVKRSIYTVVLLLFILTLNFVIFIVMPGNPVAILAYSLKLRPEQVQTVIERFGLDQPLWIQYIKYIQAMLSFEFGYSYYYGGAPVIKLILEKLPNTILLMGTSTVISIILGTIVGAIAAYRRGGKLDVISVTASLTTYSLPTFWMGMIFIFVFGGIFRLFPVAGAISRPPPQEFWAAILDRLWHLFLPALTLTLFMYGGHLLLSRSATLEVLTEDYIVTAKAKGLSDRRILFRHALRNALLPISTNIAIALGFMISGAVITEQVFTYEGIGYLMIKALNFYDYPVLQGTFFLIALSVVLANFTVDLLYGFIDPRVRY